MPALTDVPRSSEEWRAFLQSRVAGFGRTLAAFVLGFYVFANSAAMLHPLATWHDWIAPLNLLVLSAGLICAAVFLILRAIVIPTTASLTGTPLYLSPESITAPDKVDARSDLYAVGAVAFWLLTGTHVFEGNTVAEVCSHHLHTKPEAPSERLGAPVPADLDAVILRCLEKDPARRYGSAEALAHALDACESVDDWSDDLAVAWWKLHKTEADEAKPKIESRSRMPGPIEVDLEGRTVEKSA